MQVGVTVDSRILEAAILEAGRCVTVDSRIPGVTILECRAPIFISVCQSRNRGSSIQNARRLNKPGSVVARDLLARCQDALGDWACDSVISLFRRTALAAVRRDVYRCNFATCTRRFVALRQPTDPASI